MTTLFPFEPPTAPITAPRQGRSKKKLRKVLKFDGRVFVARYEGRPGRVFGATSQQVNNNLQAGGA